jgi:hypothetical protein
MKRIFALLGGFVGCLILTAGAQVRGADPLQPQREAVAAAFGKATVLATRLLKSERSKAEPLVWLVFAEDAHRKEDLVKIRLQRQPGIQGWVASSAGAGQLLQRVPPSRLDWMRVRVGPAEARLTAEQGAKLAKTTFDQVAFQLATQPSSGAPEWAVSLFDTQGFEVGFVIVSAETGAVVHQDFTGPVPPVAANARPKGEVDDEVESGEEAARAVKRGARKAWDWTEKAGKETKGFFKELFR